MAESSCRSVGLGLPGETLLILPVGHETLWGGRWVSLHQLSHVTVEPRVCSPPAVGHPGMEQVHELRGRTSTCVPEGWHGKCVRSGLGS